MRALTQVIMNPHAYDVEPPTARELNGAQCRRRRYEIHSVSLPVSKATFVLAVSTTTDTDVDTPPICERRIVIRFNWIS
jgi:hypothetical protein